MVGLEPHLYVDLPVVDGLSGPGACTVGEVFPLGARAELLCDRHEDRREEGRTDHREQR